METLWDGYEDLSRQVANGCISYNPADEALHRKGQYGEPYVYTPQYTGVPNTGNDDDEEGDDGGRGFVPQYAGASFIRNDDNEESEDVGDGPMRENGAEYGEQLDRTPMNQGDDAGGYVSRYQDEEESEGSGDTPKNGDQYGDQQYRVPEDQGDDDEGQDEYGGKNSNDAATIPVLPNEDFSEGEDTSDVNEPGTSPPYVDPDLNEGREDSEDSEDSEDNGSSYDQQHRSLRARY